MVDISLSITCTAFLRFWELAILVTRRGLPAGWKETRSAVQCHPAGSLSGWDGPRIPGTMGYLSAAVFSRSLLGFPLLFSVF